MQEARGEEWLLNSWSQTARGLLPALEPWEVTAFSCASSSHLSNGDDGNAIYVTDSLQMKCVNMG